MPFIPHTEEDVAAMLSRIGAKTIEELFDEIPIDLKCGRLEQGFLRVRCDTCHAERLVAFSCKRHGYSHTVLSANQQGTPWCQRQSHARFGCRRQL